VLAGVSTIGPGGAVTNTRSELTILALNSGSSSLKFGLYRVSASRTGALLSGAAESIGEPGGKFRVQNSQGGALTCDTAPIPSQRDAIIRIGMLLEASQMPTPAAIGHRIVHGGPGLRQHCVIDEQVMQKLDSASAFAPLHIPAALSVIRFAQEHFPDLPQMACFDTTFHAGMPDVARLLPIPQALRAEGIERYGFHGLSCESIVHQLGTNLPDRLVIAHLGNGASVTAVKAGKSVDTSMGLTPSGGIIMGTRTGDLDPGILVYLMREKQYDAAALEDMIDHRSGLIGISGISSDMRRLHDAASTSPDARLAIDMFCYSVRKQIAAMMVALGGADMIVFTGGIGENDNEVRAAICAGLSWCGIRIGETVDPTASRIPVNILASQEDEQIARHTWALSPVS
jgi:acetate kinase